MKDVDHVLIDKMKKYSSSYNILGLNTELGKYLPTSGRPVKEKRICLD